MCCPSEGASVGMISVDCINFNSVGVQEPKLHEIDEMGYLDERWGSKKSPVDCGLFKEDTSVLGHWPHSRLDQSKDAAQKSRNI